METSGPITPRTRHTTPEHFHCFSFFLPVRSQGVGVSRSRLPTSLCRAPVGGPGFPPTDTKGHTHTLCSPCSRTSPPVQVDVCPALDIQITAAQSSRATFFIHAMASVCPSKECAHEMAGHPRSVSPLDPKAAINGEMVCVSHCHKFKWMCVVRSMSRSWRRMSSRATLFINTAASLCSSKETSIQDGAVRLTTAGKVDCSVDDEGARSSKA